jgi:hypothetical protein
MVDGAGVGGIEDGMLDVGVEAATKRQEGSHKVGGADDVAAKSLQLMDARLCAAARGCGELVEEDVEKLEEECRADGSCACTAVVSNTELVNDWAA